MIDLSLFSGVFRGICIVASALALIACASSPSGPEFPKSAEQIDSRTISLGTGACQTTRTGVWRSADGIIVEIRKPQQYCRFTSLLLVTAHGRYLASAFDGNFERTGSISRGRAVIDAYTWNWRATAARVYFRTPKIIGANEIIGIAEEGCAGTNDHCLDERSTVTPGSR